MSNGNAVWNGTLTGVDYNYMTAPTKPDNSLNFILQIVSKFDVPFSMKKYEEGTPGSLSYFRGALLTFGNIDVKVYDGHMFTDHDKENVMLKLAAMYPEKILTTEEMKKHIYKDALKEEK